MSKKLKARRRQFLIKRNFQLRFMFTFIILVLVGGLVSVGLLYYLSQDTITATFEKSHLSLAKTSQIMLPAIIYTNLIVLILIGIATAVVVLFISHKIAGPLYRFEKSLEEIEKGNLTLQFDIRKGDQLRGIVGRINKVSANLRQRMEVIHNHVAQIHEKGTRLKNMLEEAEIQRKELHQSALDIEAETKDLKDAISYFKIK